MSLLNAMTIAGTGMSAQNIRLNTIASNLSNAETVGPDEAHTYHAKEPIFQTILSNSQNGFASIDDEANYGVRVASIYESKVPLQKEYNPAHPMADNDGYIFKPNVNSLESMANMISASRSYQMMVEVANTAKRLSLSAIHLGQ